MTVDDDVLADIYRHPSMDLEEMYPVEEFFETYLKELEAVGPGLSSQPPQYDPMGSLVGKPEALTSSGSNINIPSKILPTQAAGFGAGGPFDAFEPRTGAHTPTEEGLQQRTPFANTSSIHGSMMLDQRTLDAHNRGGVETSTALPAGVPCLGGYASGSLLDVGPASVSPFAATNAAFSSGGLVGFSGAGPRHNVSRIVSTPAAQQSTPSVAHVLPGYVGGGGSLAANEQFSRSDAGAELLRLEDLQERGKKSRHRTPRQQMLNKQAQQRYRERKKAKAQELEHTVATLSSRIGELRTVKKEKQMLEEKTLHLERALLEKEAELQRMKALLSKKNSERDSNCSDLSTADFDESKELSEQAEQFHSRVTELRVFMREHRIDVGSLNSPDTSDLNDHLVKEVGKKVDGICNSCMQAARQEGPNVWELITASIDRVNMEGHDQDRWVDIARSLALDEDQKKRALILWGEHTKKLNSIYEERQQLNLEAIGILLPSDHGGRAPRGVTKSSKCLSFSSFLHRATHRSKTVNILEKLKCNLREEQKALAELEYLVFHRVLNPIQGGWFTLACYPQHCDCLSLLSAAHEIFGDLKYEVRDPATDPMELVRKAS